MDACKKHLTFQEKELIILRETIDKIDEDKGKELVNTPEIKKMVSILETFLQRKKLICYGGTAINNILPKADQFYDRNLQIPDYDFFSKKPVNDAKELADIYSKAGFSNVEAKAGVHFGTYKVFVNFIPIADITLLDNNLFDNLLKESIRVNGIHYAPPNYLRMSMYLELSRPNGDVSRWEKVLKRLILLNKNYPLTPKECSASLFQRPVSSITSKTAEKLYNITLSALSDRGVVFFGGYASFLFSKYMPAKFRKFMKKQPDFDVISDNPEITSTIVKERLEDANIKNVKIVKHDSIGEVIPEHYEIRVEKETLVFIYQPIACHSYNEILINRKKIKVASIDTILSLYLAFLYAGRKYYDNKRILCMASFLFEVQRKNRLAQKGVLKRFPTNCYGEQHTIDTIRTEKSEMWNKLKNKRNSEEFEMWFLNYKPEHDDNNNSNNNNSNNNSNNNNKKKGLKKKTKKVKGGKSCRNRKSGKSVKTHKTHKNRK
jgi:uncharacterized protein YggL (DUF469 family)